MPVLSLMWKGWPAQLRVNMIVLPAGKLKAGFRVAPVVLNKYAEAPLLVTVSEYVCAAAVVAVVVVVAAVVAIVVVVVVAIVVVAAVVACC